MNENIYALSDQELIRRWGAKLKSLRVQANFSQTELAQKTGMSRSSIAEIEKGRNFSIGSLIALLKALKMLEELTFFLKEVSLELTPMEFYELQKKRRKRGGYNK